VADTDDLIPPRPPDGLIDRVTPGVREFTTEADRKAFDESGRRSVRELQGLLALAGRKLDTFESILDFGCGSGRMTRWMAPLISSARLRGCDIDEQAIEWARENLTFAGFDRTDPLPPLPYRDAEFDLVYNHSVFTHLDAEFQDHWLGELERVTRPGGLVVLTVHGEWAFHRAEMDAGGALPWRDTLVRDGILFVSQDGYIGSSFPEFYHTTFHAPWYVFEHWSRWFEIAAYVPRGDLDHQDLILLRRRAPGQEQTPPLVARPGVGTVSSESAPGSPGQVAKRIIKTLVAPVSFVLSPAAVAILNRQAERIGRLENDVEDLRRRLERKEEQR